MAKMLSKLRSKFITHTFEVDKAPQRSAISLMTLFSRKFYVMLLTRKKGCVNVIERVVFVLWLQADSRCAPSCVWHKNNKTNSASLLCVCETGEARVRLFA
jgi:hypothetical protein